MKQRGPWKIKSSAVKYKNPWLEVRDEDVENTEGVQRVKTLVWIKPGVAVLPIDKDGNVYLGKEYRYAIDEEVLLAANGAIEKEETSLDAAKRELKEELGILARDWIDCGVIHLISSKVNSPQHLFLARNIFLGEQEFDGTERLSVIKMPFDEALRLVHDGKITEAGAVVLILKAAKYLGKL